MKSAQDDRLLSANDVINLTFKMAPRLIKRLYRVFSPSRNKNLNHKPFSGKSQEIVILWKMNKGDSSLSFRLVRCAKAEIFAEMFRAKL